MISLATLVEVDCNNRTVLEVKYLFHAQSARKYLFQKYSSPPHFFSLGSRPDSQRLILIVIGLTANPNPELKTVIKITTIYDKLYQVTKFITEYL